MLWWLLGGVALFNLAVTARIVQLEWRRRALWSDGCD
jgi:hypothetical protein